MTMQRALILTALAAAALLAGCGNPVDTPVSPPVAVTGVALDVPSLTIDSHESRRLAATVSPADASDTSLEWTSGDRAVAEVDSNGRVLAMGAGTTTITATTNDGGYTSSCEVTVVSHAYVLANAFSGTGYAAGYWKDEAWIDLPGPAGSSSCYVMDIAAADGKTYAGGYSETVEGASAPAYWIDTSFVELSSPWPGRNARVYAIAVADGHVYAGGYCISEAYIKLAGYWLDGIWQSLVPDPIEGTSSYVWDIAVSEGKIYAAGYRNNLSGYWVDGVWTQLSDDSQSRADTLLIEGSSVYVGGLCGESDNGACYWKDGTRTDFPVELYGEVESLTFFEGALYAAGRYEDPADSYLRVPAYWTDGEFHLLEPFAAGKRAEARFIGSSGHSLYVTLEGEDADGNEHYGVVKNGVWSELLSPEGYSDIRLTGMFVY